MMIPYSTTLSTNKANKTGTLFPFFLLLFQNKNSRDVPGALANLGEAKIGHRLGAWPSSSKQTQPNVTNPPPNPHPHLVPLYVRVASLHVSLQVASS